MKRGREEGTREVEQSDGTPMGVSHVDEGEVE
jgi:hypothetical protein